MTRDEGLAQIDQAKWVGDEYNQLALTVTAPADLDWKGAPEKTIQAWLSMRPTYCDRGHIQLLIDGIESLDRSDSFPRYFFSLEEADAHTRLFLKWRLWKWRKQSHLAIALRFTANDTF